MTYKIIKAGKILLGKDLEIFEDGVIVTYKDRIVEIFHQNDLAKFDNFKGEILDLKDLTIMPGLIDCHCHLNIDASIPDHLELLSWSNECELTLISLKGLKDNLFEGITTVRCLGDKFYTDVTLKKKVSKNEVLGPDILSAGIGIKGFHGAGYIGAPHCGEEEVRKTVRENLKRNVDTIKLFITPGKPSLTNNFIPSYLSLEEIKVAVSESKKLNIPVAAHCIGGRGLKNCIDAGVQVIEHMYGATDEDIILLKNSACWVDLTPGIYLDSTREDFLSTQNAKDMRDGRELVRDNLKKIIEAKIPFTLGTDSYHGKLYKEVLYAIDLGASTKDALKAITSNAAKVCYKENTIGSIEKGYLANIIAIDGNPYDDILSLSRVNMVMKRGTIYKNIL